MHYRMTYPEGEVPLEYLRKIQDAHPGEMEILNVLEPRKIMQKSVTILRRTSKHEHRTATRPTPVRIRFTPELLHAAQELISRTR